MPPDPRQRTSWTLKHASLDRELRTLVAKAAAKQGMGAAQWAGVVLRERALSVLRGDQAGDLPVVAPARIDSIEERLAALEGALRAKRRWWPW